MLLILLWACGTVSMLSICAIKQKKIQLDDIWFSLFLFWAVPLVLPWFIATLSETVLWSEK